MLLDSLIADSRNTIVTIGTAFLVIMPTNVLNLPLAKTLYFLRLVGIQDLYIQHTLVFFAIYPNF